MVNTVKLLTSLFCVLLLAEAASAGEIKVSAAVSLKEVINELSESFAKKNPGVKFLKNYGASGPLAKQIENVAPVDIFIPANLKWMKYLKNKNLLDKSSIGTFTYNYLVFAGPANNKISRMQDLVRLKKIVIGRPESVAAGYYSLAALKNSGVYEQLDKQLILAKDSRDCLTLAEKRKADGAFVYRTDALQAKQAKILFSIPQGLYPRVIYPMALTVAGASNKNAIAFFKYLQSSFAKAVLNKYGFALK
jgi:molybdate transport system substrate-binding protein